MKKYLIIVVAILGIYFLTDAQKTTPKQLDTKYKSGKLEGRKLSDLYASYLGVDDPTTIGKHIETNFQKNFASMWDCKEDRCASTVVAKASEQLVSEYKVKHTSTTFINYTAHISVVVSTLKKSINWEIVAKKTNISTTDAALVKSICNSFTGKDMAAYAMTELMPSADGQLNVTVMDFLLRNAGREYIEGIPAMHDGKTSFGPYQFTEYAVYDTPASDRGASVINTAVASGQKIPGSVIKLRGDDHHRAAFLFAVYNVCSLVRNLNATQKKTLKLNWSANQDDLFLYCATAHHNPSRALSAAKKWLDNKAKYAFEKSCGKRISYYAVKTRKNLAAM